MRRRSGTALSLSQSSSVSSESSSILAISIFAYSAVPSSRLRLVFVVPSLLTAARLLLLDSRVGKRYFAMFVFMLFYFYVAHLRVLSAWP